MPSGCSCGGRRKSDGMNGEGINEEKEKRKQWRFVCRSCVAPPQAQLGHGLPILVAPTSELVDKTQEASREFVDATHEAWSATAELVESIMKGSTQAAAVVLRRITHNDLATAVMVLLKVTHSSVTKAASLVAGMISLSAQTTAGLLIAMMDASWNMATNLIATLVEESPRRAIEVRGESRLLLVLASKGREGRG